MPNVVQKDPSKMIHETLNIEKNIMWVLKRSGLKIELLANACEVIVH